MNDNEKIRQLEQQLAVLDTDPQVNAHLNIDTLNELAWLLRDIDAKRSLSLCNSAYSLSDGNDGNGPLYQAGVASSICVQQTMLLGSHSCTKRSRFLNRCPYMMVCPMYFMAYIASIFIWVTILKH